MQFVHKPYGEGDTIAAIATPPGEGGVAIVRISGKEALNVAAKVFSGPVHTYASHTAHFGKILDEAGVCIDEALLLPMRAPRSYTGEDTVEIQCHGGTLITRRVLETVLKAGARAAGPGEFTFKAFLNGKIDLAQAEAVQVLISARNELALKSAEQQLSGKLSEKILSFQKELTDCAAILEAWVDFPEEGLEFATVEEILSKLEAVRAKMEHLAHTFHEGKILHEGITLCLAGSPNVGKSSLMNALLGKQRAIVTDIPGTTRDLLEDDMRLGGLHFRIMDTAGIRETTESIEKEGIRRSKEALKQADLILLVLDASRPLSSEDRALIATASSHNTLLVWNKIDLPHTIETTPFEYVALSAKEERGLDTLKLKIEKMIWQGRAPQKDEIFLTNQRHHQALLAALAACDRLLAGLRSNVSPEFLSADMRAILTELGTIIGTDITEDILSAIFSKFCVGK